MKIDLKRIYELSIAVSNMRGGCISDLKSTMEDRDEADKCFDEQMGLVHAAYCDLERSLNEGLLDSSDILVTAIRGHLMGAASSIYGAVQTLDEIIAPKPNDLREAGVLVGFDRIYKLALSVSDLRGGCMSGRSSALRRQETADDRFEEHLGLARAACHELEVALTEGRLDCVDHYLASIRGHLMGAIDVIDFAVDTLEDVLVSTPMSAS